MENYITLLDTLSECTEDYLYVWNIKENKIWCSKAIYDRYDLPKREGAHCTLEDIIGLTLPGERETFAERFRMVALHGSTVNSFDWRWIDKDGKIVWLRSSGRMHMDEEGNPYFMVGIISEAVMKEKVDTLTGCLNKKKLSEDLSAYLTSNKSGFLLVLGIDDFKNINIRFGREYGDQVLLNVAKLTEEVVGTSLQVYRLEGDCFAVHLPETDKEEVLRIYEEIQSRLPDEYTISAGAVCYEELPTQDFRLAYQYMESALDKAKQNGKNTIYFFAENEHRKKISEIELLEELKESVKNGCKGFYLVYQPQVDVKSYRVYGAEALLRYKSAKQGMVFPDRFIPLLEETGLICPVGLWVLETALKTCKVWREKNKEFRISVNISYVQLKQPEIVDNVLDVLKACEMPGEVLTLEVTESMQLQNFRHYNEIFYRWKNAGIEISVDDFGTGYSSLAYLKNLKIDEIKIDRCFVSGIQFSSYNCRLLTNVLELAHSSDIRVCCEGVESKGEMKVLEGLQADLMQGYLFSKPCEEDAFRESYIEKDVPEYYERLQISELRYLKEASERLHQQQDTCLDDFKEFHYEDILKATDIGLWVIRIDEKTGKKEMFADETMRRILAVDGEVTPEECFNYWFSHIKDGYYDYVNHNVEKMIDKEAVVQLQYTWVHPLKGDVVVRCTGIRVADKDHKICLEGYHHTVSDIDETRSIDEMPSKETFEYNGTQKTIFFHTERRLLSGDDIRESDFPECWIKKEIVHPHFVEKFRSLFEEVKKVQDIKTCEMMLKSKHGEYEWFRVKIRHLGEEERDKNTILVQLHAANQERRMELENMRIRDFYHASLSETIAYAELDLESGQMLETGGMWNEFVTAGEGRLKKYLKQVDFKKMVQRGKTMHRITFEHDFGNGKIWTELVIHIFVEQYSENVYALIYLKDVDVQMKKEIAQRQAAELDSLTKVYNRKAFKEQVKNYLRHCNEPKGTLIMLDIDDFKLFNDQYGHLVGDAVLRAVASELKETFEQKYIAGRYGGDEFLVFLKEDLSKEQVCSLIDKLFAHLEKNYDYPILCCAGILMLQGERLTYEEMLTLADAALYRSKENGKHQYFFA